MCYNYVQFIIIFIYYYTDTCSMKYHKMDTKYYHESEERVSITKTPFIEAFSIIV